MENQDSYCHEDENLVYIMESIPGASRDRDECNKIDIEMNMQIADHCQCTNSCSSAECTCIKLYLNNYCAGKKSQPILNFGEISHPILECNSLCSCSSHCGNRLVQFGPSQHLVVKQTNQKGYGLFATSILSAGSFVCEYAGEIITKTEALLRQNENSAKGQMNYIFCLNEHSNGNVTQTIVDPNKFGNIGRYINHSCEPNCCIVSVRVDNPVPKFAIFAKRDIEKDEEITFDYGSHNFSCEAVALSSKSNRKKCLCQSNNCRVWLPFESY